jgi:arylsulfatase A-like enzyme
MKIKKIIIVFLSIVFILIAIKLTQKKEGETIIRKYFNQTFKDTTLKYKTKKGKIIISLKNKNRINIQIEQISSTIQGSLIKQKEKISIKPNLKGRYLLNFSAFQISTNKNLSKLCLNQKRGDTKIYSHCFKQYNKVFISNININLEPDDIISFSTKGKLISIVSEPVFIKSHNKNKRYIFLIGVDTLRRDHIGVYNKKKKNTPNIDKFSKDSVIFTNAFSTAPWTLPAFTSVITGLYAPFHGSNYGGVVLGKNIKSLFEEIKKESLVYGITGDYFLSYRFGFSKGTDLYTENLSDGMEHKSAKILFERTKKIIDNIKNNNVLFFLHTYQVHNPYKPEKKLADNLYKRKLKKYIFNPITFIKFGKELCKKVPDKKRKEIEKIYDAGVYTFDYRFGEFIRYLKKNNIYNSSMIVFFADHGEEFEDHGCWEHGHTLYNELIKIPLIIKFPKNKYNSIKISENVAITDILPTVMDYYKFGQNKNLKIQGQSVIPFIKGEKMKNRIIISYLAPKSIRRNIPAKIAIIDGKFKLIYNQKIKPEDLKYFIFPPVNNVKYEMFNLQKDPYEKNNIFYTQGKSAKKLKKILKKIEIKKGKNRYLKSLKKRLKSLGYL